MRLDANLATVILLFGAGANAAPLDRRDAEADAFDAALIPNAFGPNSRQFDCGDLAVWEKRTVRNFDGTISNGVRPFNPFFGPLGHARRGVSEKREAQRWDITLAPTVVDLAYGSNKPDADDVAQWRTTEKREAANLQPSVNRPPQVARLPQNHYIDSSGDLRIAGNGQLAVNEKREAIQPLPKLYPNPPPIYLRGPEKRNRDSWAQPYPPDLIEGRLSLGPPGAVLLNGNQKRNRDSWAQPYPPSVIGGPGPFDDFRLPGPILLNDNEKREAIAQGFVSPAIGPPVTQGARRPSSEKRQEDMEAAVAAEKKAAEAFPGYRARVPPPKNGIELAVCGMYIGRC